MESRPEVRLDLWYDTGCPHAAHVRELVMACLAGRELSWTLHEHVDAGMLSPTLLVDGADVVSARAPAHGCRLDLPTSHQIRDALMHPKGVRT